MGLSCMIVTWAVAVVSSTAEPSEVFTLLRVNFTVSLLSFTVSALTVIITVSVCLVAVKTVVPEVADVV